jgi:hypothetical protein
MMTSCSKEEDSPVETTESSESKAAVAGAFVYKMNFQRKCPNKGKSCDKKSSAIDFHTLNAFESAISNGASGLKDFYTNGPWRILTPDLDVTRREIYNNFVSGNYEAIRTVEDGKVVYSFGRAPLSAANAEYLMISY